MMVSIFKDDRFYGQLRMKLSPPPFTTREGELLAEIVERLPLLRGKKITISFN